MGDDLCVHPPVESVVVVLHRIHPPDGVAFLELGKAVIREAHVPRLPLLHQAVQGLHGLLERRVGVRIMHQQDVDVVGLHPLQALFHQGQYVVPSAVPARPRPVMLRSLPAQAALGHQRHVLAASAQGFTQHLFRVPQAVVGRGIEAVDSHVDGPVYRGAHLVDVLVPPQSLGRL